MAELKLTEEEKEEKSYLNWDDESLGKYVKKKAIDNEDYFGEKTSKTEARLIPILSQVAEKESDMIMMEVKGLTVDGEDVGKWRITFERVDPDLPDGIDPIDQDGGGSGGGGDGDGGILVP